MKHPRLFRLLFHPKFFVTGVFFWDSVQLEDVFVQGHLLWQSLGYTPTNWRPTLACQWGVSCIDLASHSKVHATRSRDRLWNKGRQQLETTAHLYGKLGFVWKQSSVLGRFWKSWVFNIWQPFLPMNHSLIHFWSFFAYWRVSRKLQSCKIFTHQIFKHKFCQRKHFQIQHINLKINSTVDVQKSQGQPPWDGAKGH